MTEDNSSVNIFFRRSLYIAPEKLVIYLSGRGPDGEHREYNEILVELSEIMVKSGIDAEVVTSSSGSNTGYTEHLVQEIFAAVSSGGAVTALAVTVHKLIEKHKDSKVSVIRRPSTGEEEVIDLKGYSPREIERILSTIEEIKEISRERSQPDNNGED